MDEDVSSLSIFFFNLLNAKDSIKYVSYSSRVGITT